jgi:osmotically-inducible protein OsmY
MTPPPFRPAVAIRSAQQHRLRRVALPWLAVASVIVGSVNPAWVRAQQADVTQEVVEIDDKALAKAVQQRWRAFSPDLAANLSVTSHQGRLLLTGIVTTADERADAVRLAWQTDGTNDVLNEIMIGRQRSFSERTADLAITARLRGKLLGDPEITSDNFDIETINGIVYLHGRARSPQELERVQHHVRDVPRVRKLVSHVRLPQP